MKKILAVMVVVALLAVCGAAVAEKTKKVTKTTTQKGPKAVWLTDMEPISDVGSSIFIGNNAQMNGHTYAHAYKSAYSAVCGMTGEWLLGL